MTPPTPAMTARKTRLNLKKPIRLKADEPPLGFEFKVVGRHPYMANFVIVAWKNLNSHPSNYGVTAYREDKLENCEDSP